MTESGDGRSSLALLERRYGGDVAGRRGWDSRNWDAQDFLHAFGSPQSALLCAALFVPEFMEIEGAVFLRDLGPKHRDGFDGIAREASRVREESCDALKAYVDSCNWVEVAYLFSDTSGTLDEYDTLADMVAEAWRARLQFLYPSRRFIVRVLPPDVTGSVVGVGIEEEM